MNWWSAFTIGFLMGGIIALLGARLFQEEVEEGAGESQDKKNGSVMTKAFLHKVSQGPEIVAIGGGTGLSTLLSGLKYYTRNITAIVTVTDEGGSSGRLRGEWGVLPPGDIRNCMLALAEDDSSLNRLLNYRFDRGELKGHSMGNLHNERFAEIWNGPVMREFRLQLREKKMFPICTRCCQFWRND